MQGSNGAKSVVFVVVLAVASVQLAKGERIPQHVRKTLEDPRIVGGEDAAEGRFPYMCSLRNEFSQHQCGAVLINSKWALTGAHCVHPQFHSSANLNAFLTVGAYRSTDNENVPGVEEIKIKRTHIHPNFTVTSLRKGGDIALLELMEPSSLSPVPLPDPQHVPDDALLVLGWGRYSPVLQQAYLDVEPEEVCKEFWDNLGPSIVCASSKYADTCRGDSGGPLIIPHAPERKISDGRPKLDTLIALTSFGDPNCSRLEVPGAYTLVAPYMPWIETIMEDDGQDAQATDASTVQHAPQAQQLSSAAPVPRSPMECTDRIAEFRGAASTPVQYNELLKLKLRECTDFDVRGFEQCDQEFRDSIGCCTKPCSNFLQSVSSKCWTSLVGAACKSSSNELPSQLDKVSQLCGGSPAKCPAAAGEVQDDCEDKVVEPQRQLPENLIPITFQLITLKTPRQCDIMDFEDFQMCGGDLGETRGCCTKECINFLETISDKCWGGVEGTVCSSGSEDMLIMLDLLFRRCDVKKRRVDCFQEQGKAAVTVDDVEELVCEQNGNCDEVNEALLSAAESGDVAAVQGALVEGADVEATDGDNYLRTALHWAAHQGHVAIVKLLVEAGADLEASSKTGVSPLMYAASAGRLKVAKILLAAGADMEAVDKAKWTALIYAARYGHADVVELLAQKGANLEAMDTLWRYSPLVWAAMHKHGHVVELLIEAGADIDTRTHQGWTTLMLVIGEEDIDLTKLLLKHGADVNAAIPSDTHSTTHGFLPAGSTALHIAAHAGYGDIVKVLVAAGADKDALDSNGNAPRDVVQPWSGNSKVVLSFLA